MYIHMRIYENAIIKLHPSFAQFGQLTSWPFNWYGKRSGWW